MGAGHEELAKAVCDKLVADGKLKEKPAFIRNDRQAKIVKVFTDANLDPDSLTTMTGRAVEVAVRKATEGEAWVDDVQRVLQGMLSEDMAKSTEGVQESEEMKALRKKMTDNALAEFGADSAPPPNPERGGPRRGGGGGDRDDAEYGSFGGARGGGGACYNCGKEGHQSRDCPEPRQDGYGGGRGGGGGACYNCGKEGHQSRDCPEPRQDGYGGGRGGGGGACYNCGQEGHQSRDCPEPRRER